MTEDNNLLQLQDDELKVGATIFINLFMWRDSCNIVRLFAVLLIV